MDIILLAAGLSKRMGQNNKLLMDWKGEAAVVHCAEVALSAVVASKAGRLVVVTGYQDKMVRTAIKDKIGINPNYVFYTNKEYEKGQFTSLQAGLKACALMDTAKNNLSSFMVALSDMPIITKEDYLQLIEISEQYKDYDFVRPIYNKKPGHPVVCSGNFRKEVLNMPQNSQMKNLLSMHKVKEVIWTNNNVIKDFDTLAEYKEL